MDIRFLLLLLLPALVTAGIYPYEAGSFAPDVDNFDSPGDKVEGEDMNLSGFVGADVMNEGRLANQAIEEYDTKAKTVEQCAKWYRNLLNEKLVLLAQVKKRYNVLRTIAAESLQSAEQHRKSAAEKSQTSKALETKAREAQILSKDQTVQVNELKVKLNSELKQHLNCLINSRVAETNAEIDIAEAERQRTWGTFLEKQAQDMLSEAAKWERRSAESHEVVKKLKCEASTENAKGKEFDKKRKEAEDAANEADKKARNFCFFHMEFNYKSQAEELKAVLAKIKGKYFQMIAASLAESATYLEMFYNLEYKDATLWEKKTAGTMAEAKLLETSANKMIQNIEKLKSSMKRSPRVTDKGLAVHEDKVVKVAKVPAIVGDKKV